MPVSIQRVGVIAVLLAALGLAGCGRKGALDAPPSAAIAEGDEATSVERKGSGTALPVIRGPKKRIPLDALLD
jgi:predicted small lipoprotein YifL